MSTADADLARVFHLDPDALRCPHAAFDRLREEAPVTFVPEIECWVVSRFEDIVWVTRNPQLFSSSRPTGPMMARQQRRALDDLFREEPELAATLTRLPAGTACC